MQRSNLVRRHWRPADADLLSQRLFLQLLARHQLQVYDIVLQHAPRARQAPRRVLSLLVYAHSLDKTVPNHVVRELYREIYES